MLAIRQDRGEVSQPSRPPPTSILSRMSPALRKETSSSRPSVLSLGNDLKVAKKVMDQARVQNAASRELLAKNADPSDQVRSRLL